MANKEKFYITTTLPYVNADPHIGFAAEIVRADVLARWARLQGKDVFFNTGVDEHGLKIYRKSREQGKDPQSYTDEYAAKFDNLKKALNLSYNNFIRTTDENHKRAAQEFWRLCDKNGDIYKKNYQVKYCVGCELELTESDLVDGKCPHHPNQELELIDEENYFFRWSNYGDKLLEFYEKNPDFVIPQNRFNEIKEFVKRGLKDFSISRLKLKMPWGVPVPGDDEHVMYVWFDALTNYINCLNWLEGDEQLKEYWGTMEKSNAIQVAGKDNLRQQTAMWQAMLMSAGFPTSKQVLIFGFITADGQKMSKSIGNVINPFDLVEKYGTDAVRYYLLSELRPFEDSDFSYEKFETKYNADLANGLGNLVARVISMTDKYFDGNVPPNENDDEAPMKAGDFNISNFGKGNTGLAPVRILISAHTKQYVDFLESCNFDMNNALYEVGICIGELDKYISDYKPFKLIKEDKKKTAAVLYNCLESIRIIAILIFPFLPKTSEEILKRIGLDPKEEFSKSFDELIRWGGLPVDEKTQKGAPLFPRIDNNL